MAWWSDYTPHVPLLIGAGAAGIMAGLRVYAKSGMTRAAKLAEAATCAGLSTAISETCILYLGWSTDWAMPIGVFVGWLGTNTLRTELSKLLEKLLNR